jgi:hypothetical protein
MHYFIKVLEHDGSVHALPQVDNRDDAVNDAEVARNFSWCKRVMVFRARDRYGGSQEQIAEMSSAKDRVLPAEIPFEGEPEQPEDEE